MERIIDTYSIDGQTIEYSITGKEGIPVLVMHGDIPVVMRNLDMIHLLKVVS